MANPFQAVPRVDEVSLVCKIGDQLVVHQATLTEEGERVEVGSLYEVEERVQHAWILRLVQGPGATQLRILNSKLMSILRPKST